MKEQIIQATLTDDVLMAMPFFLFSIIFAVITYIKYKKKQRELITSCICWICSIAMFIISFLQVDLPLYDYATKSYFTGTGYVSGYSMSYKQPHIIIDGYECRITEEYFDKNEFVEKYVSYTVGANSDYIVSIEEMK